MISSHYLRNEPAQPRSQGLVLLVPPPPPPDRERGREGEDPGNEFGACTPPLERRRIVCHFQFHPISFRGGVKSGLNRVAKVDGSQSCWQIKGKKIQTNEVLNIFIVLKKIRLTGNEIAKLVVPNMNSFLKRKSGVVAESRRYGAWNQS